MPSSFDSSSGVRWLAIVVLLWLPARKSPRFKLAGSALALFRGTNQRPRAPCRSCARIGFPVAGANFFGVRVARCGVRRDPRPLLVGGEGPPIVPVHGLGGAAYNFTDLAAILSRRRRVLVPDLPGHGAPSRSPVRPRDLADRVAGVAEREGMMPAAVLGYSLGGAIALRLAAEAPVPRCARGARVRGSRLDGPPREALAGAPVSSSRPQIRGACATPSRSAPAYGDRLRILGRREPRALQPEAVLGFLEAQPELTDLRTASRGLVRGDPREYWPRFVPGARPLGRARLAAPLEDGFEHARRLASAPPRPPRHGPPLVAE